MTANRLTRRNLLLAGLSSGTSTLLASGAAKGADQALPGWREAILIVRDLQPWIDTLTQVGGWEVAWRGLRDCALNRFWSLPAGAQTEQTLMRNIGTRTGMLRLVKVGNVEQSQIRSDDQAWETGGIQALDLRVVDIEGTRKALHERGWRAPSEPVRYSVYGVDVIQWAPVSPDGIRLSFIQRIAPPLVGWAELKRWGHATNAAITVKDMASSQAFCETMGLKPSTRANSLGPTGRNVMGLPSSYAHHSTVDIRGYTGVGSNEGAVELISLPGISGRDFSGGALPPNLGIAGLRFFLKDAAGFASKCAAEGLGAAAQIQQLTFDADGSRPAFAVRSPDGLWLEFVQAL